MSLNYFTFHISGVYFKQLGMNPAQCGMLIGVRPFIELCSAPMWGGVADRFKKGKTLLLLSMVCWIAFTIGLAYIQPPANSCVMLNGTGKTLSDGSLCDDFSPSDYHHLLFNVSYNVISYNSKLMEHSLSSYTLVSININNRTSLKK